MKKIDVLTGDIERLANGWLMQQGFIRSTEKEDLARVPDVEYGDRIEIHWGGDLDGVVDIGLIVPFTGQDELDANMGGLVWIESPDNPGGKDSVPPQWETLYTLRSSPDIKEIKLLSL